MEQELFLFIQAKIGNLVKDFDWWNNQFETEEDELLFRTPATFIEILPYKTESLGRKRQAATIGFNLHVGYHLYENTRKGAKRQSNALKHLKLITDIQQALHGVGNNANIGTLSRVGVTPDHSWAGYIVHVISYQTRMVDDAAVKQTTHVEDVPLETEI